MQQPRSVGIDAASPFERGRQRGAQVRDDLRRSWPIYQQLFAVSAAEAGRAPVDVLAAAAGCLDAVWTWSPDLLRELEGVAEAADVDLPTVMALNARTEILALARGVGATECSTLVALHGDAGTALSAQTWDWHADLADGWHVQTVEGDQHAFVGLTEFGMLAKIGVNDAGLGVHVNLLRHASDADAANDGRAGTADLGVPVHLLARSVLGSATSVPEAVDLVRGAPVSASTVITVVTPDDAACVEISPAGVGVVEPAEGWLVHTNHFLDARLAAGERVTLEETTSFERADLLETRVKEVAPPVSAATLRSMLTAHDDDGVSVCRHLDPAAPLGYRTATLATVVLDPAARSAHISAGGPCRHADVVSLTAGG